MQQWSSGLTGSMVSGEGALMGSVFLVIAQFQHGSIDLEDLQDRTRSALDLAESPQQHLEGSLAPAEADSSMWRRGPGHQPGKAVPLMMVAS